MYRYESNNYEHSSRRNSQLFKAIRTKVYGKDGIKSSHDNPIYLNTPQGRRLVGYVIDEHNTRILEKKVIESKHLHKRFNAWGVDAMLLDTLPKDNISIIRIKADTGAIEQATIGTFYLHGIRHDFGFGPQVFLPRKYFTRIDLRQGQLFA